MSAEPINMDQRRQRKPKNDDDKAHADSRGKDAARESMAEQLLTMMRATIQEYWRTPDNEPFVTIVKEEVPRAIKVRSSAFRELCEFAYVLNYDKGVTEEAVKTCQNTIAAIAKHNKTSGVYPIFQRVGYSEDAIWIDLGSRDYKAVKITAEGWSIIEHQDVEVKFWRNDTFQELPEPVAGGSLEDLRDLFHDIPDEDWAIYCGFLASVFQRKGTRAFLEILGQKGSGKSTIMRYMINLIDPTTVPLRAIPANEVDLAIAAKGQVILGLDNLSYISPEMSDIMCQIATGMAIGKRKLHTDDEDFTIKAHTPICWTSISQQGTHRSDLRDRVLTMNVPRMPEGERVTDEELDRYFNERQPSLLGAIYDMVSIALRNAPHVKIDNLPRLADFAVWAEAAAPAFGLPSGYFVETMKHVQLNADRLSIENSLVAPYLVQMLTEASVTYTLTATELYQRLRDLAPDYIQKSKFFPQHPNKMREALTMIVQPLENIGVSVQFDVRRRDQGAKNPGRKIVISRVEPLFTEANLTEEGQQTMNV